VFKFLNVLVFDFIPKCFSCLMLVDIGQLIMGCQLRKMDGLVITLAIRHGRCEISRMQKELKAESRQRIQNSPFRV